MTMGLCQNAGAFDFVDECIRATWASLLPAIFVACIIVFSVPAAIVPSGSRIQNLWDRIVAPFRGFITLDEAIAYQAATKPNDKPSTVEDDAMEPTTQMIDKIISKPPRWRTILLAFLGLIQCLAWLIISVHAFMTFHNLNEDSGTLWGAAIAPLLVSISWAYAAIRPAIRPPRTVPYDLFVLYILHFIGAVLLLGGTLYALNLDRGDAMRLVVPVSNFVLVLVLLSVVMTVPFAVPSAEIANHIVSVCKFIQTKGQIADGYANCLGSRRQSGGLHQLMGMGYFLMDISVNSQGVFVFFPSIIETF